MKRRSPTGALSSRSLSLSRQPPFILLLQTANTLFTALPHPSTEDEESAAIHRTVRTSRSPVRSIGCSHFMGGIGGQAKEGGHIEDFPRDVFQPVWNSWVRTEYSPPLVLQNALLRLKSSNPGGSPKRTQLVRGTRFSSEYSHPDFKSAGGCHPRCLTFSLLVGRWTRERPSAGIAF